MNSGMFIPISKSALFIGFIVKGILSGPAISVDQPTYDAGAINEGERSTIEHVFKFINSGDSTLYISKVRPSCGCNLVSYDSIIPPGKGGRIDSKVNIGNIRAGEYSKTLAVESNAKNTPSLLLNLKFSIDGILDIINPDYADFMIANAPDINDGTEIWLYTRKSDLKVTGVSFKKKFSSNHSGWQGSLQTPVRYSLSRSEKPDAKGYYTYDLKVATDSREKEDVLGDIIINTNHPKKPLLQAKGFIKMYE